MTFHKNTMEYLQHLDPNGRVYKNIMYRKMNWKPFGKAKNTEHNDKITIAGDEIEMEIIGEYAEILKRKNTKKNCKPCTQYCADRTISDELKEENYKRWKEHQNKYIKKKVTQTINGKTHTFWLTSPVVKETYKVGEKKVTFKSFEEIQKEKEENSKKNTEQNTDQNTDQNTEQNETNDTEQNSYVPPHLRIQMESKKMEDSNAKVSKKLIIRNIDAGFMEDDIAKYVLTCGKIHDITILRDKYTGVSRGIAFVKCLNSQIATEIMNKFHKTAMGHTIVSIDYAEDRNRR